VTLLYHTLWLPTILAVAYALKRLAFDAKSLAVVLAGLTLCYTYLYHSTAQDFNVDVEAHQNYIRYIDEHNALPQEKMEGMAAHHLPTYYITATAIYKLARASGMEDPFQAVRFLTVACYAVYLLLAALTLRRVFQTATKPYMLALAMVAFWPIGVAISARIHLDAFAYIGEMGVIYTLVRYVQDRDARWLANSFLMAGVLLLARNFGIYFFVICGGFLAHALYAKRATLNMRMLASIAFALACYTLSAMHRNMLPETDFTAARGGYSFGELLTTFGFFNPWQFATESILSPMEGTNRDYFWHFYLRSAILGDHTEWVLLANPSENFAWAVAFALGVIWMFIVAYTLLGVALKFRASTRAERPALYLLAVFLGMMTALLMAARYVHMHVPNIGDVRYFLPITAIITVFFAKCMEWYAATNRHAAVHIGNGLALGFILLSIGLWLVQMLPL
jgi:hypothetical protein